MYPNMQDGELLVSRTALELSLDPDFDLCGLARGAFLCRLVRTPLAVRRVHQVRTSTKFVVRPVYIMCSLPKSLESCHFGVVIRRWAESSTSTEHHVLQLSHICPLCIAYSFLECIVEILKKGLELPKTCAEKCVAQEAVCSCWASKC